MKTIKDRLYLSLINSLFNLQEYKITYGEMEYNGIKQLYNHIKKINPNIDCFINIDSGCGNLCMYMATQPKIKMVVGIEIIKESHEDALDLKSNLKNELYDKVELINNSIFDVELKNYKTYETLVLSLKKWEKNVIIKIKDNLRKGTLICCLNPNKTIGELLESVTIPIDWTNSTEVYIYRL